VKIFYPTPLFNRLQVVRFDTFCLQMIGLDRATITISLQSESAVECHHPTNSHRLNRWFVSFRTETPDYRYLVQVFVFRLGLLEDNDVRISVFIRLPAA
jgi:hypothetical protein